MIAQLALRDEEAEGIGRVHHDGSSDVDVQDAALWLGGPLQSSGGFAMQGELLCGAVPKANELLLLMMPPFPRL